MQQNPDIDIRSELEKSQERESFLKARIEDLSDFIEHASLPLHWVNGSGVVIWANQTELDLLGYSKEEFIGKHVSNFHADKRVCEDILGRLIPKETLNNYPATLQRKDGTHIPVLINSNVRWDGDKFLNTRCFTRDISMIKRLEEENAKHTEYLENKIALLEKENTALKEKLNIKG